MVAKERKVRGNEGLSIEERLLTHHPLPRIVQLKTSPYADHICSLLQDIEASFHIPTRGIPSSQVIQSTLATAMEHLPMSMDMWNNHFQSDITVHTSG